MESSFSRFDQTDYVSMTMEFRCNLKCVHCMIEGTMDRLEEQPLEKFHALLEFNARERRYRGLILTGSEITLRQDLPELARQARRHGFEHVRIQTHGVGLFRDSLCRELIDAGVDEFFVSVAGCDTETHDDITGVPGSWDKMLRGLENLERYENVISITNTVVTRKSYRLLPRIVERLSHLEHLVQMEFWFYFPMSPTDDKGLLVSHLESLPYLKEAMAAARALGRGIEVKNFPECLLGDDRGALMNDQPQLHIDPAFWTEFHKNGFYQCVFKDRCASQQCLGLNTAYIERFGWHEDRLVPLTTK